MNEFYEEKGIKREYNVARTPQQNKIAERRNRTQIEAVRTMLANSKLPNTFWAEAVNIACYVLNMVLVVKPHFKTPYELFRGRTVVLSFMRPFGCHVTILNTLDRLGKFDGKSDEGFFVGYSTNSKAFRVYNTRTRKFHLQKVWTLVDLPRGKRAIGTKWVFQKKDERGIVIRNKAKLIAHGCTQEEGINYDEFFALVARIKAMRLFLAYVSFMRFLVYQIDVKSAFLFERIEEEVYVCQPPGFEDPDYPDKVYKVEKSLYGLHQAPRAWNETLAKYLLDNGFFRGKIDQTMFIKRQKEDILLVLVYVDDIIFGSTKKKLCTKFETHVDLHTCLFAYFLSQEEPKSITNALKDPAWVEKMQEELLQFHLQKVWTLVDLPRGKRAIGTKWVFQKKDERGIVIRNKAKLIAHGCTQEEGINYDEFFALVARIKAMRLFLAYVSFMRFLVYQIDVKSAFLFERIEEEAYVCQPPGFEDPDYPDKVYKVEKSLYGLHQAPRAWNETLAKYLLDNGFFRGKIDQTMFIKRQKEDILLVLVYVDDIIFGSTKKKLCTKFESVISNPLSVIYIPSIALVTLSLSHNRPKPCTLIKLYSSHQSLMANLEVYDKHNMVAFLKNPKGSEDFHQIVDFLIASHIRYALTENPTIYVSLINQFWYIASVRTLANGEIELNATIDDQVKTITEASVRRHLKLANADGISTLPTTGIFE
nr:putative ribonuclease H-like domain-containing protein [Tanacetum cinerariifolium]